LVIVDIGIPAFVLEDIAPRTAHNGPEAWLRQLPRPTSASNKYTRGHAIVCGGGEMTGAARLAARGARRIGTGLVTIAAPPGVFAVYASDMPGTLIKSIPDGDAFRAFLKERRWNAVLVGPGAGVSEDTRDQVLAALAAGKFTVLDADSLSVFADDPDALFSAISSPCVLTPHEGEFSRIFAVDGDKLSRTRAAAERSGAVVILKGSDTVIASPDGHAVIDSTAPPELSTGGTGDVLAGFVLGFMAQGMTAFDAACAAVWFHGAAAAAFGPGLIAEDLPEQIPLLLRELEI
jgi:NAD(P)H-hydrate epimerase